MIAPQQARPGHHRNSAAITEVEAREILQHPVFGDEQCIRARELLVLAERVRRRREAFQRGFERVHFMTAEELEEELAWWDSWTADPEIDS